MVIFYRVVTSLQQTQPCRKIQEMRPQNAGTCQKAPKMRTNDV